MRTIKAQPLTKEAFEQYGTYASIVDPKGNCFGNYYPDQVRYHASGVMPVTFSALDSAKPEKMIVKEAEYHNKTGEGVLPIDDDVVLHVAPPSKEPVPELTEAFLVPKGTMVTLFPGVWHEAALPVHEDRVHVLIVLPERTYLTDSVRVTYSEEDQIEIIL